MPVKTWGDRTIVDLDWKGPKMFSSRSIPKLPSYRGVYLISSRKMLYGYPHGRSSLAYIGSGFVADRIDSHVRSNLKVKELLRDEGTLRAWYARAPHDTHRCVEQVLFDEFEQRHGDRPILNHVRPSCPVPWDDFKVRHEGMTYPYDLSRSDQPR